MNDSFEWWQSLPVVGCCNWTDPAVFSIAHPAGEMSTSDEPRRGEAHTTLDARRRQAIDLDDRHEPFIKKREDL
jgi:hypothetical protein